MHHKISGVNGPKFTIFVASSDGRHPQLLTDDWKCPSHSDMMECEKWSQWMPSVLMWHLPGHVWDGNHYKYQPKTFINDLAIFTLTRQVYCAYLQVPTRIGADVLGGRQSGNLCHCWQVTPTVRWHRVTFSSTKDKDHARYEEFCGCRSSHLEQFTTRRTNRNSLPLSFTRHLKSHLFSWLTACLRTIYNAL